MIFDRLCMFAPPMVNAMASIIADRRPPTRAIAHSRATSQCLWYLESGSRYVERRGRHEQKMSAHRPTRIIAAALAALLSSLPATSVQSAELKIFGSRVTKMIMADIGPQFAQATGYTPVVVTDVAAVMKRRIEQGEPFDLAVLVNFQTDALLRAGKLAADSRADVMKAGIGVAVKRGALKPDISTVDAFKRALLDAKSITYLKEGASTLYLDRLFARLGIAEALAPKTIKPDTESVSERVADGEVELGLIVIPNILSVPGAELVGPIPAEVQSYIVFTAAASAQSPHAPAARELIKLMTSPAVVPVIKAKGMEPG
jgi:molybdate transport system substrate-binding protein